MGRRFSHHLPTSWSPRKPQDTICPQVHSAELSFPLTHVSGLLPEVRHRESLLGMLMAAPSPHPPTSLVGQSHTDSNRESVVLC